MAIHNNIKTSSIIPSSKYLCINSEPPIFKALQENYQISFKEEDFKNTIWRTFIYNRLAIWIEKQKMYISNLIVKVILLFTICTNDNKIFPYLWPKINTCDLSSGHSQKTMYRSCSISSSPNKPTSDNYNKIINKSF